MYLKIIASLVSSDEIKSFDFYQKQLLVIFPFIKKKDVHNFFYNIYSFGIDPAQYGLHLGLNVLVSRNLEQKIKYIDKWLIEEGMASVKLKNNTDYFIERKYIEEMTFFEFQKKFQKDSYSTSTLEVQILYLNRCKGYTLQSLSNLYNIPFDTLIDSYKLGLARMKYILDYKIFSEYKYRDAFFQKKVFKSFPSINKIFHKAA